MQNYKVKKTRPGSTGPNHWNYQHGNETLAAKQERSERSLRLRYIQEIGHQLQFMGGRRMPGRKPVKYVTFNYHNPDHLICVIKIINGD
jgi:hypothetical protein